MIELGAIVVGIFLGVVVSGFPGFAFSAAAGAVLIHVVEPNETIPLMMACSIISQVVTMLTLRRSVRFEANPIMLSGGVAGVALAVAPEDRRPGHVNLILAVRNVRAKCGAVGTGMQGASPS